MGTGSSCLTVPVESASERQTTSLAPLRQRWSSAAWQEENLAPPLSPLLYLQPDGADADERWRALNAETVEAKLQATRPIWLAEQPAEVQRRFDERKSLAVKQLTVAPAPAQPDAVLLQTVLRRRSHSGRTSPPSTLSPPQRRSPECSPGGSPLRRDASPKSASFRSRRGSSRLSVSFRRDGFASAVVPSPISSAALDDTLNNLPTSPRSPKPFLVA